MPQKPKQSEADFDKIAWKIVNSGASLTVDRLVAEGALGGRNTINARRRQFEAKRKYKHPDVEITDQIQQSFNQVVGAVADQYQKQIDELKIIIEGKEKSILEYMTETQKYLEELEESREIIEKFKGDLELLRDIKIKYLKLVESDNKLAVFKYQAETLQAENEKLKTANDGLKQRAYQAEAELKALTKDKKE